MRQMDWAEASFRQEMIRFAALHIQPLEEAEEAVQDTFCALMEKAASEAQDRYSKAYIFGILKHKILDRLRLRYREPLKMEPIDEIDDILFDETGHWEMAVAPVQWTSPETQAETDDLLKVVEICVTQLPQKIAQVFSMKEFLECDPQEICSVLAIEKEDYWQCMSRARKRLQLCLNQKWYQSDGL